MRLPFLTKSLFYRGYYLFFCYILFFASFCRTNLMGNMFRVFHRDFIHSCIVLMTDSRVLRAFKYFSLVRILFLVLSLVNERYICTIPLFKLSIERDLLLLLFFFYWTRLPWYRAFFRWRSWRALACYFKRIKVYRLTIYVSPYLPHCTFHQLFPFQDEFNEKCKDCMILVNYLKFLTT